jgi:hypothetical protein
MPYVIPTGLSRERPYPISAGRGAFVIASLFDEM